jgi:N-hydroxyarylamine O-acetyltransferase
VNLTPSTVLSDAVVDRYLARIGLDGSELSLSELHLAHVRAIPFENLDIALGREIRLDLDSLVAKLVDRRRGGYCFEQNALYAAVLESLGFRVTRCLARYRMEDATSPRPATHMALLVEGQLVDVGFGAATPMGPVPLGEEATYEGCTWRMERAESPEGEPVWLVRLFDMPLYSFTETPHHPVDYLAPNHLCSTHPQSVYTQTIIVQRWDEGGTQVGLVGLDLLERRPDAHVEVRIASEDLGTVLRDRFGLDVDNDELNGIRAVCSGERRDDEPSRR